MKSFCCALVIALLISACNGRDNVTSDCGIIEKSNSYLDIAVEIITKARENYLTCPTVQSNSRPMDCEELQKMGHHQNGVYTVWPKNRLIEEKPLTIFCDMQTDGGGWTVIQRRGNFMMPKDYFYREWSSYKTGFGEVDKEFWIGNDNIFALTNQRLYSVRFDLVDVAGEMRYALYDRFWIDDEDHHYTLHIKEYSGDAGDSMTVKHDSQKFSTKDKDNDINGKASCALAYKGGWWYGNCHDSNLNGLYLRGKHSSHADGVNWKSFRFHNESLESTEIKIRPKSFKRPLLITQLHETPKE